MIKRIKNLANTEEKKRLFSNFFSLSILQAANYIFPLITLPYLVRVLGVENFGLLAFATALITYFSIITDYGFNLTATREISIHRENSQKITEIFSSVMTIKVILMLLSFFLLTILVFSFEKFSKDWEIYFLTFATILGQVLFPIWLFQGMERMKYITYLNVLSRLIFTVAIFIFVQEQNDYYMVPLLTSLGSLVAGIWSLVLVKREFGVIFVFQKIGVIKHYLVDGWHVFISRIAVVLYTSSNIFVLGIFTSNTMVGYYSIAEKISQAIVSISSTVSTVAFPYLSKIYKENIQKYNHKLFYFFKIIVFTMLMISIATYLMSDIIIELVANNFIEESVAVLKILCFTIVLFPLGGLFTEIFIIQGVSKYVTKATLYTATLNTLLVFSLIYKFGIYGLAFCVLIVQVFQVMINTRYFLQNIKEKNKCAV